MVQFCYVRLCKGIETVSCRLLQPDGKDLRQARVVKF